MQGLDGHREGYDDSKIRDRFGVAKGSWHIQAW